MSGTAVTIAKRLPRTAALYRRLFPVDVGQPDWPTLLGADFATWQERLAALPADAPRVALIPSPAGPAASIPDSILAIALTLRGAHVTVVLCDHALPACANCNISGFRDDRTFVKHGPQLYQCQICFEPARSMFTSLGLPVTTYGDHLRSEDRRWVDDVVRSVPLDEIGAFELDGMAVGEHAVAGAIRFYAGDHRREPHGDDTLRRYFAASLLTGRALPRLFAEHRIETASFHHGIYIPQGVVGEAARQSGVRVVNWMRAYRRGTFIYSHGDTYHHTLMSEPTSTWEDMPWTPAHDADVMGYLESRWTGAADWISFNRDPTADVQQIEREIGVDLSKPTVVLLTNVAWDAQLHYPANAFPDMLTWIDETVRHFAARPDIQLVIRVHPAEVTGELPSRQPVVDELRRTFGELPPNIFVVGPESKVSTYALALRSDAALVYGTKTGVELTAFGLPVVVAGEAWIRNKGLTIDATSRDDYLRILGTLPLGRRMDAAQTARARRYAYHFFFRRMIPLPGITASTSRSLSPYEVSIRSLAELEPGADTGLDVVCDGILTEAPFVYPAERLGTGEIS